MNELNLDQLIADFVIQNKEKYYRLAFHYVKNQADALDVVHESIIKALSNKETLQNPDFLKTWFYRIVINTSIDLLRKQERSVIVDDNVLSSLDGGKTDHYEDVDLKIALTSLPVQYRSVIILRYFEDFKLEEIAQILDKNINTVKTRLYKALSMLRITLNEI
ncbi:RNA polymerase sigma factor SigV [Peribacillus sp. Bi96]|uniref:sigma-70 family RNA polymerase sigma factor n=1 Tax=unclassified Peribacillus TaxID=2675266 RepID=UPI001DE9DF65|nr:sigma-70 family RNA polymerase sigma factor [Peribacillus sp. Bi96]CAH0314266.1 RNA polymerase sigma factor SigV [Peribacillus sp. Bi96]